jgi:serine/threonine protein kinase
MAGDIELWCMVMELIDGIDLAEYLEDNGILSEEKALPIIQQVGSALSFVHKQGFSHLDVKPQNIMIRTPPSPPLVRGGVRENPPFSSPPLTKGARGVQFFPTQSPPLTRGGWGD